MSGEPSHSLADSYLGGPVGVHQNHVLGTLFDLQLDVILSFQGGQAAAAVAHSRLTVGGIWGQGAFCVKTKKKSYYLVAVWKQPQICLGMCCWSLSQIYTNCK